jgi:integrase
MAKTALDKRSGVGGWTIHDLRRTFRTGLGKLRIPPHIAERCLNHSKGGIEAIYDRYHYEHEIKAALVLWSDHVREITTGVAPTVVPLRGTAL